MKSNVIVTGSLMLFVLGTLAGCGGNVLIGEGDSNATCGLAPQSTIKVLGEQADAEVLAISLEQDCMDKYQQHVQALISQGSCDEVSCPQQIKGEANTCSYNYAMAINKPTESRCGAQVLLVPKGVAPEEYIMNFSQEDTDGDGVSNFDEYKGHSDPCVENSLDSCKSDGDMDYDNDGLPNATDPAPTCPGSSESPCI